MIYRITICASAKRDLKKLDRQIRERIQKEIDNLAFDCRPPGCKKLVGLPKWRIRVGDWRIIYQIDDGVLLVMVVRVGHRREIYD